MPEAIVAIGEGKRIVGRLRFEADTQRQHSQFEYADQWLAASDCFALSPATALQSAVLREMAFSGTGYAPFEQGMIHQQN